MYILNCAAFDSEGISARFNNLCCKDCHSEESGLLVKRVYVTPRKSMSDPNPDWELGIQAEVCCGRFHFVASLSREWWVRKKGQVDGWTERQVQEQLERGSWHARKEQRATTTSSSVTQTSKAAGKKRVAKTDCPSCGSSRFDGVVCNNCGYEG